MARPRGQRKTARLTVSLDPGAYSVLVAIAKERDVSVAWLARRAIIDLIDHNGIPVQGELPLPRADQTGSQS
jgi:hypothetical protein